MSALPLALPLALVRHRARRLDARDLLGQVYLEPHPRELMLRNHARFSPRRPRDLRRWATRRRAVLEKVAGSLPEGELRRYLRAAHGS